MAKLITVPKDADAQRLLDYDRCPAEQLIELVLHDDQRFDRLWNTGVFEKLNMKTGSMIDDFEEDHIKGLYNLKSGLEVVTAVTQKNPEVSELSVLENLFNEAIQRKTGVFFYF